MNATIFETQQRADDLLREALGIWRQSVRSDLLEGIENDPIFSLLMSAVAYQANSIDNQIEQFKAEVLEEYAQSILPYGLQRAIPAGVVVEGNLQENVSEAEVNENTTFHMKEGDASFMPLLSTRALNLRVQSVTRLDGRRWKVTLKSPFPITDLSRFSFAIHDCVFQSVNITIKGQTFPLIRPWQYADLPLNRCFSTDTMLYNKQRIFNASSAIFDLYARHNVQLFCIRSFNLRKILPNETDTIDLVMEFTGISDDFVFDKSKLALNVVILVNAQRHSATLSSSTPVYRVEGDAFLHLLRPQEDQLMGKTQVEVRQVAADRFNQASLLRLLQAVVDKYDSDYYAFRYIPAKNADRLMASLRELIKQMIEHPNADSDRPASGVYLLWHDRSLTQKQDVSLNVEYLTTPGTAINKQLRPDSTFSTNSGFDNTTIRQLSIPVQGCDELGNDEALESTTRYYVTTQDRLVTQADIKMFCRHELFIRYGISDNMIRYMSVEARPDRENMKGGYTVVVDIILEDSSFIQRTFVAQLQQAEFRLNKMIEVRSANIYPTQVNIEIEKNKE
jgi:hypothetical protein